jgi:L-malate glycosyltransferase
VNIIIVDNSIATTGALNCAVNEAELLSGKHRFVFVLPTQTTQQKKLEEKGFKVYTLPMVEVAKSASALLKYFPTLIRNTIAIKKILKKEKIDVFQANDFYNMLGVMSKFLGFKGKLITYVRFIPDVMPQSLRKIWISLAQKHSDKVIGVSKTVLEQLPANSNTIFIYDPIEFKEIFPEKIPVTANTVNILYLSNYIRGKGQEHAVEAFAKAYEQNKNIRLQFTGGDMGLDKNKQFKQELQNRTTELGLQDVITFTGYAANVETEIKKADIVLNFSEAESFSMTCSEAAYYGTSLIATRCGGPEEIIVDKVTGLLVPRKDINAMSEAILTLASSADLRRTYAEAGKKLVKEKFTAKKFMKELNNVLETI